MPKKLRRRSASRSSKQSSEFYWHFVIPCVVGGAIAWFFSGSIFLAVVVLLAVLVGNFVGYELVKKR